MNFFEKDDIKIVSNAKKEQKIKKILSDKLEEEK